MVLSNLKSELCHFLLLVIFLSTLCFTGEELHARIGVCPQQYVAVGELTVREQVRRFLTLRKY